MKKWIVCLSLVTAGCVSDEAPVNTDQNNQTNNVTNNANNATNNATNNVANNSNNANNNATNNNTNNCIPNEISCDDICGMIDDGCGGAVDCGTCNCENGVATSVPCGPCDFGGRVCAAAETGDGTCVTPDVITEDNCNDFVLVLPGSDDGGAIGTKESPFGTISAAINHADQFDKPGLLIAEGIIAEPDGLLLGNVTPHMIGGYNADFERDTRVRPQIEVAGTVGLQIQLVQTPTTFENLEIIQSDQMGSAVGMIIDSSDQNLVIRNVFVQAGAAGNGADGIDGVAGMAGADGDPGLAGGNLVPNSGPCIVDYLAATGGNAQTVMCADGTILSGNDGGDSQGVTFQNVCDLDGGRPGAGAAGVNGGSGGIKSLLAAATPGDEAPAFAIGADDGIVPAGQHPTNYHGANGTAGVDGLHGSGGGGGGGGFNSNMFCFGQGGGGGAGGSGGCGGSGGTAGNGGYHSVALIYADSTAVIENSTFVAGNAGSGGRGGDGGIGGTAGTGGDGGAAYCANVTFMAGGAGGNGATGQNGGHGTGGVGGDSIGVWGTADIPRDTNTVVVGTPGVGGASMVGNSPDGQSAEYLLFDSVIF